MAPTRGKGKGKAKAKGKLRKRKTTDSRSGPTGAAKYRGPSFHVSVESATNAKAYCGGQCMAEKRKLTVGEWLSCGRPRPVMDSGRRQGCGKLLGKGTVRFGAVRPERNSNKLGVKFDRRRHKFTIGHRDWRCLDCVTPRQVRMCTTPSGAPRTTRSQRKRPGLKVNGKVVFGDGVNARTRNRVAARFRKILKDAEKESKQKRLASRERSAAARKHGRAAAKTARLAPPASPFGARSPDEVADAVPLRCMRVGTPSSFWKTLKDKGVPSPSFRLIPDY